MRTSDRLARTVCCAMVLLGVLLLAFAWGLGQVIEEARTYAVVHGMTADTGQDQTTQTVVLLCAGVVLLAAALLRLHLGARRRAT